MSKASNLPQSIIQFDNDIDNVNGIDVLPQCQLNLRVILPILAWPGTIPLGSAAQPESVPWSVPRDLSETQNSLG